MSNYTTTASASAQTSQTSTEPNPNLEHALAYAAQGWRVFPLHTPDEQGRCSCHKTNCDSVGKHPRTMNGLKDATTDEAKIRHWWGMWADANVGIATGAESSIVALDVDPRHGGNESLAALLRKHGELPLTLTSVTGSGGSHFLFTYPGVKVKNSAGTVGAGLDVKGDGGYIVAAPSLHASLKRYRWVDQSSPLARLPHWLLVELTERNGASVRTETVVTDDDEIPEGTRNQTLLRLAGRLRRIGLPVEAIGAALQIENERRCVPPLESNEVQGIAEYVCRFEPGAPYTAEGFEQQNGKRQTSEAKAWQPEGDIDVCMADVQPEEVEWLVEPYIPLGKFTLVEGDPDEGKSFATLAIAAAVTNGGGLPFGDIEEAGNVLLLSAEDGRADTIRPRLDLLGADVRRVFAVKSPLVLNEKGFTQLEGLIAKRRAAMVVIDPLFAYVGGQTDINQDNKVRAITSRLSDIAERQKCSIVALRHLSKAQQRNAKAAGGSSIAWTASARSVLLFGHEPDDEDAKGFVHTKHNLSRAGKAQGYRIDDVGGKPLFRWTGVCGLTSDKILASPFNGGSKTKLEEAIEFLSDALESDGLPEKEIRKRARKARISIATLRRAKDALKVSSYRPESNTGAWWWKLSDVQIVPDSANEHLAEDAEDGAEEAVRDVNSDAHVRTWEDDRDEARRSVEHVDGQPQTYNSSPVTALVSDAQTGSPGAVKHLAYTINFDLCETCEAHAATLATDGTMSFDEAALWAVQRCCECTNASDYEVWRARCDSDE